MKNRVRFTCILINISFKIEKEEKIVPDELKDKLGQTYLCSDHFLFLKLRKKNTCHWMRSKRNRVRFSSILSTFCSVQNIQIITIVENSRDYSNRELWRRKLKNGKYRKKIVNTYTLMKWKTMLYKHHRLYDCFKGRAFSHAPNYYCLTDAIHIF